jgi:hypothetical protein
MAGEIEERRADCPRRPDHQDRGARREWAAAGQHLERGEIGERNAYGLRDVDSVWDRNQKAYGADRVFGVAAHDAEVGDHLSCLRLRDVGTALLDNSHELIARSEGQRAFEIRVMTAPDEAVGESRASREHLDPNLARAGIRKGRFRHKLQDLGAAKSGNANMLPGHEGHFRLSKSATACVRFLRPQDGRGKRKHYRPRRSGSRGLLHSILPPSIYHPCRW